MADGSEELEQPQQEHGNLRIPLDEVSTERKRL
jgi:hypothetical protein